MRMSEKAVPANTISAASIAAAVVEKVLKNNGEDYND